jgi:ketosteroid isomerase-like protein
MDLTEIEARLRRLEDIEAARGIYQVYAKTLDVPVADTVAELFTEDAVLHTPIGDFTGRDAVREFFRTAFDNDPSVKRHFIVNPRVVASEPGRVTLTSYFLYVGRGDDSLIGWGTYDDVVDVTGPEPRFREKTITVHHGTTLSAGWAGDES